ncbi:uncharacterized protein [Hyperolius riggenbachi]|uniref:uncharacterized protein n=1 Tax=Hyperolius riggenbachi TaxID=752182 RepID=UPI0035A3BF21
MKATSIFLIALLALISFCHADGRWPDPERPLRRDWQPYERHQPIIRIPTFSPPLEPSSEEDRRSNYGPHGRTDERRPPAEGPASVWHRPRPRPPIGIPTYSPPLELSSEEGRNNYGHHGGTGSEEDSGRHGPHGGTGGPHSCKEKEHKVWSQCNAHCADNCLNYRLPHKTCTKQCEAGCVCKYPYVFKKGMSGPCVHRNECFKFGHPFNILSAGQEECGAHQVYQSCGTACPDNCERYGGGDRPCILPCVQGCFCQYPYIFQSGESGACILPEECPPRYTEYAPRS